MGRVLRGWTALVCAVGLLAVGAVLVSPASATMGLDWRSIWRHRIEPRADHRYYTKGRADHRFAARPRVLRGDFVLEGAADNGDEIYSQGISWGWNAGRIRHVRVVKPFHHGTGRCYGTVAHPNARAGTLCVFERVTSTNASRLQVCDASNDCPGADPWGATLGAFANDVGLFDIDGSWAVRPSRHVR